MNELLNKEEIQIENMTYEIRGKQVMLDFDLAKLYGVETKRINETARNNPDKFPKRFAWIITKDEIDIISRSKFSTLNHEKLKRRQNIKYLPRVFTKQGFAMLDTILKSKTATEVSIKIMDAFVLMRHFIIDNKDIYKSLNYINNKLIEHAEKELIVIDSYADISLLNIIRNIDCKITLITSNKTKLTNIKIEKFNKQYNKLKVIKNNTFHDRYFILDKKIIYHCGTSLNHIGTKTFSINLLENKMIKEILLTHVTI